MRKPKLKKLPKKPRASASNKVLENYLAKVETVTKGNQAKVKAYHDYCSKHEKLVGAIGKVPHTVWQTIPAYDRKPHVRAYDRSSVVRKADRRVKGVSRRKKKRKR